MVVAVVMVMVTAKTVLPMQTKVLRVQVMAVAVVRVLVPMVLMTAVVLLLIKKVIMLAITTMAQVTINHLCRQNHGVVKVVNALSKV